MLALFIIFRGCESLFLQIGVMSGFEWDIWERTGVTLERFLELIMITFLRRDGLLSSEATP
jgi:hypothetical protein